MLAPTREELDRLNESQLRDLASTLIAEIRLKQTLIDKLTFEMRTLKRLRFGAKSERLESPQRSLLEEDLDADLQALAQEIEALQPEGSPNSQDKQPAERNVAKRQVLPPELPRREIRREPLSTTCGCGCALKRIGEDMSEKLDYTPGEFTVERHIRGKWVCGKCETLTQAPVPAHVIDKGLPTAGLLAQVIVAKYLDHLPLYRQESVFARAGYALARSTMAQWVGAVGQERGAVTRIR